LERVPDTRRRLLFAPIPLLVCAFALEAGLRLADYQGQPDRTVSWSPEHHSADGALLATQTLDGVAWTTSLTESQPHPWPATKTRTRYVAIGGSAVHGYGFTRAGSWPDKLERMLRAADQDVEVLNLGTIAWSSQQNLALVKEVLATQEPDALLLYMGNNEYLEWLGARQVLPEDALRTWVWRTTWSRRLRRSRSYRLGVSLLETPGQWGQSDYSGSSQPVETRPRRLSSDDAFAKEGFRLNLGRVLELAGDIPVYVSTVAVNLDYRPADMGEPMGDADDLLKQADIALSEGRDEEANALAEQAMGAGPPDQVAYIWGQTLERMGRWDQARSWQTRALELDQAPNRAQPWVNEVVVDSGAHLVRGAEALVETAPHGLVGFETVYDHCHPTPQAHTTLAMEFARALGVEPEPLPGPVRGDVNTWLGPSPQYSLDPGTERAEWWRQARDPQSADEWNTRGLVAWNTFTADCDVRGTPCLRDAVEAFETAGEQGSCIAWSNLAEVYRSLDHPGEADARARFSECPAQ
jgi:tetratricopeptide (TPR) repeat protein